ncbi:hypothetical protein J3E06_001423 [Methanococcus voltae]|uniref:Uncharacterized protein n=1 Tax=Methanococcus voltae (strain ATCC BAA-1334 / A3) TaxID=456320 RepID=D7DSK5_METV3|nr:hypothetical protein [Methanococcus voltae]
MIYYNYELEKYQKLNEDGTITDYVPEPAEEVQE